MEGQGGGEAQGVADPPPKKTLLQPSKARPKLAPLHRIKNISIIIRPRIGQALPVLEMSFVLRINLYYLYNLAIALGYEC
jgi:hypothetical protein